MRKKPLIGLNADYRAAKKDSPAFSYVAAGYYDCISAVGGIPQVMRHGESCLLFPNGDLPALCDSLREVLANSRRSSIIAEAGRRMVCKDYSLERMASEYERRYRSVIAAKEGDR